MDALTIATRKLPKIVSDGTYEEVCQLLRQGANPQTADSKGRTPLHFAACRGEPGICKCLCIVYMMIYNM